MTADILAGGDVSLRLYAGDSNVSYLFSSRAATPSSNEPELSIVVVPEPGCVGLVVLALAVGLGRRDARLRSFNP